MSPARGAAPGKVILFGEHAVVYGQPALAVPVTDVSAVVTVERASHGSGLFFNAPAIDEAFLLATRPDSPLSEMARQTLAFLAQREPDAVATIQSSIPVAGGLGSGAAVSAALGRALADWFNRKIDDGQLSTLVYEVEKLHHGTPSGIDNTVICHASPVWFVRGTSPEIIQVKSDFHLIIADTGVASQTKVTVAGVRERWTGDPARYNALYASVGEIVRAARAAIETGDSAALGPLMNHNQHLLAEMGVSSPELDHLIEAALASGAAGAKLSGGGGGGNMIALVSPERVDTVGAALSAAGAVRTIHTVVHTTGA